MRVINVGLGTRSYDVVMEDGILDRAAAHLARFAGSRPFTVITDETVAQAQWPRLKTALERGGMTA
ncbi:MAG: 3-dehydroquinate synthase, partial [Sphingobium sp.]